MAYNFAKNGGFSPNGGSLSQSDPTSQIVTTTGTGVLIKSPRALQLLNSLMEAYVTLQALEAARFALVVYATGEVVMASYSDDEGYKSHLGGENDGESDDDEWVTVYTTTDGPVDLDRQPSGHPESSESYGGTFVTDRDITDPNNYLDHYKNVVPPDLFRNVYPSHLTEIRVPKSRLKIDPTDSRPGLYWIAPGTPGAQIIKEYDVVESPSTRPIITPKNQQNGEFSRKSERIN